VAANLAEKNFRSSFVGQNAIQILTLTAAPEKQIKLGRKIKK